MGCGCNKNLTLFKGTQGPSGNYINITDEAPGENCEAGGQRVDLIDGITNQIISTEYICNGVCDCDINLRTQFGSGDAIAETTPGTWFNNTPNFITTTLEDEIEISGIYRYDIHLFFEEQGSTTQLDVGIRINGNTPINDMVRTTFTLNNPQPIGITLIHTHTEGDLVRPDYKIFFQAPDALLQLNEVRVYRTLIETV